MNMAYESIQNGNDSLLSNVFLGHSKKLKNCVWWFFLTLCCCYLAAFTTFTYFQMLDAVQRSSIQTTYHESCEFDQCIAPNGANESGFTYVFEDYHSIILFRRGKICLNKTDIVPYLNCSITNYCFDQTKDCYFEMSPSVDDCKVLMSSSFMDALSDFVKQSYIDRTRTFKCYGTVPSLAMIQILAISFAGVMFVHAIMCFILRNVLI